MTEMSYEGLVEAGRAARERIDNVQWIEGDLALQVEALPGDERPRDPETGEFIEDQAKTLKRYAQDVDIGYATLKEYRRVAEAWPTTSRLVVVSWGAHQALAGQDDRFDLIRDGMTRAAARDVVRKRSASTSHPPGWLELSGRVGDDLAKALKDMDRLESVVDRQPAERLQVKLAKYAEWARALAERLDAMREWRETDDRMAA